MSRLLLVRHGDTELNSAGRYWGNTDVGLSAAGLRQAERLSMRLATEKIDTIYASDLLRASETAKIIAAKHQLAAVTCAELREINFGQIEGLTFTEVSQLYPEVVELWRKGSPRLKYPGGESLNQLARRVGKFLDRLKKHTPEATILIVAHSGVLRTLIRCLLGLGPRYLRQFRLDLASLSILETYPQGAIINLLNDTSHLKGVDD